MAINENTMDLSQYKGDIIPCPFCPPVADAIVSHRACSKCMGLKFIAKCLNCDATGQYSGRTVWDGGRSDHKSTCTPCGGNGFFPSKPPTTSASNTQPQSQSQPPSQPPSPPKPGEALMPTDAPDGLHVTEPTHA